MKAKLRVILMADTVTVAEVENPSLWQRILSEIQGSGPLPEQPRQPHAGDVPQSGASVQNGAALIERFAQRTQIDRSTLEGAIAPSTDPPYLTLDIHCWERMKKQLAGTGASSIAALAVSATLLALWCREAGLETPTQSQAQAVLQTIGVEDKNASRAIRNTNWLQGRPGGQILINPAQNSRALLMAKCFCAGDWSEWKRGGQPS
jgi:hypothetical protein